MVNAALQLSIKFESNLMHPSYISFLLRPHTGARRPFEGAVQWGTRMKKTILMAAISVAVCIATPIQARDLLAPSNLKRVASPVTRTITAEVEHNAPFTTSFGKPAYVCSISGLGRTSTCVMRSWAERQDFRARLAVR